MDEKIRRKCEKDPKTFGKIYLSHYFSSKSPEFHEELNSLWKKLIMKGATGNLSKVLTKKGKRIALAAPRGHAKSTVMTMQNILHSALYGYKKYILLISDTESQSVGFLENIKCELEENPLVLENFGKLRGKTWNSTSITLTNGCRIDALGSGQKLRGRRHFERRPDLIVLDDIENDEEVRSPEGRRKLAQWYFSAVSKAGDYYTDIVLIGTVLHSDSLLARLLKNPVYISKTYRAVDNFSHSNLWKAWEEIMCNLSDEGREDRAFKFFCDNKGQMLEDTKVLWEEKMPYYDLMVMRLSEGESAFDREMQNTPIDKSACLFPPQWFSYYNPQAVDFSGDFDFYGYCDPSLGKSANADYSAVIVIARERKSGILYVESADLQRRHPDRIIEDIIETCRRIKRDYGKDFTAFGAEVNQFQWFLKEQLGASSAKEGIYLPLYEVRAATDKVLRVQTLQPFIKNGYIKFLNNQTLLLNQLWDFPQGVYDDGPDSLEGCVALAKKGYYSRPIQGLNI